ncbi:MAG: glycosyltransferase [Desulfotignum sp.]|nr:glycosyltransferase [Desulfotignum sp.]MCF8088134.1 glycosyltransferase [Desulfotignum sp.]MCF8135806.1 glycosyltransferase [Desulfotignum sp.]
MTMKLLQIGPYPPPLGGWSFHIKLFKKHLDKQNIHNEVLNIGPQRRVKSDEYIDVQGGVDYLRKVTGFCTKGYLVYVHLNGDSIKGLILTLAAQIIARVCGSVSVLSFHAGVVQHCFSPGMSRQKLLAKCAFHLARGIMCNSDAVKTHIEKLGIPAAKVAAIPCFSKQYVENRTVIMPHEEQFLQTHTPVFISYLFFWPEYEPEVIFNALPDLKKQFSDFGLIVVGPPQGGEPFMTMAKEKGVDTNILQTGEKAHDNFLSLVERSTLMIRVHRSDGVCSSVMEALAKGVPVVADDNGTRPDGVVVFNPGDSMDLVAKVKMAVANRSQVTSRISGMFDRDAIDEEQTFLFRCHDNATIH